MKEDFAGPSRTDRRVPPRRGKLGFTNRYFAAPGL